MAMDVGEAEDQPTTTTADEGATLLSDALLETAETDQVRDQGDDDRSSVTSDQLLGLSPTPEGDGEEGDP